LLETYQISGKLRYISEPDRGMYDAINKGLALCRGNIIAYLNTDDLYFPWTVEVVNAYFAAHADVDVVYGDTLVLDMNTGQQRVNIYPEFSPAWLRSGAIIAQPTVFLRRNIVEKVGKFGLDVGLLGDCEYWLRCLELGARFAKIHELLAIECNHGGTLRQTQAGKVATEKKFLVDRYGAGLSKVLRGLVLRWKYVEKEILTLAFMARARKDQAGGQWGRFLAGYRVRADFGRHLGNKVLRRQAAVWNIEER
jgi:glycosyltransferase involved in cell wall biosynthesis